jgi:hypothetical protein
VPAATPTPKARPSRASALAARNEAGIGKTGLAIRLTDSHLPPILAHVLPLTGSDFRTRLQPTAVAAVFIGAPPDAQRWCRRNGGARLIAAVYALLAHSSSTNPRLFPTGLCLFGTVVISCNNLHSQGNMKRALGSRAGRRHAGPRPRPLWNNYTVPQWTYLKHRTARWDRFGHPDTLPEYNSLTGGFPTVWWWDAAKAAKTGGRQ